MDTTVYLKIYDAPLVNKKEILRYMGAKKEDDELLKIIDDSLKEALDKLTYKVCYITIPVDEDGYINLGNGKVKSEKLSANLKGSCMAILFGATIGIEIDRLIAKYGKISPIKALAFQAIGAERIEALCDAFSSDIKGEYNIKPRFSPGYGDFDISYQKEIFNLLKPERKIGLTLNESLVMTPSKSVTAVMGLTKEDSFKHIPCEKCSKKDCEFRRMK